MSEYIPIILSGIAVITAIFSTYKSTNRISVKDIEERAEERATTNLKLDMISKNVIEIKEDIKCSNAKLDNLDTRVTVLERDNKTIFKKFDEVMKK